MSIKDLIQPTHKAVAVALGRALFSGNADDWETFMCVTAQNLAPHERRALGYSAIRVLEPDDIGPTLEAVLPSPPMNELMQVAEVWAISAGERELEAYWLAAFNRMAQDRQVAALGFVQGKAAT